MIEPKYFSSLSLLVYQAFPNVTKHVVNFNGDDYTIYTKNGRFHREDGPALISDSYHIWFQNGDMHCETGPAHIWLHYPGRYDWYFRGICVSFLIESWLDEFKLLPKDPHSWTDQQKVYFKLTFGGIFPEHF